MHDAYVERVGAGDGDVDGIDVELAVVVHVIYRKVALATVDIVLSLIGAVCQSEEIGSTYLFYY